MDRQSHPNQHARRINKGRLNISDGLCNQKQEASCQKASN
nr:MAG TPA: hypothetical protein [Caudoviricetes sp.]